LGNRIELRWNNPEIMVKLPININQDYIPMLLSHFWQIFRKISIVSDEQISALVPELLEKCYYSNLYQQIFEHAIDPSLFNYEKE